LQGEIHELIVNKHYVLPSPLIPSMRWERRTWLRYPTVSTSSFIKLRVSLWECKMQKTNQASGLKIKGWIATEKAQICEIVFNPTMVSVMILHSLLITSGLLNPISHYACHNFTRSL
jgi:hypothetical protein